MKTDSVVRARTPTMTTTTTGAHVTVGVQEPVSTFVLTRTEASARPVSSRQAEDCHLSHDLS
jgi:hypothetical protein